MGSCAFMLLNMAEWTSGLSLFLIKLLVTDVIYNHDYIYKIKIIKIIFRFMAIVALFVYMPQCGE